MKIKIRTPLLYAAISAVILCPSLSSCSQADKQSTAQQNAAASALTAEAEKPQAAPPNDQTTQNAKTLLKAMSDYLAKQQNMSFDYDSVFEVVSDQKQKFQVATSGTIDMSRPDKIHATRKSGFSDTETIFDGKTLTILGKGMNAYVQTEAPGTIDQLIDALRDKFHRQLPGADLLGSNVYDALMTDVTDIKDMGSGVINGKECDHLAFRAKETDWQIWIAQGGTPYPCRYVITSKGVDQAPQYTLTVRDWKAGGVAGSYTFTPPPGAKKMDVKDLANLKDTADLPENYKLGAAK